MKNAGLRRLLICGTCCWLIWATPSKARFLQADPVGYEDQVNLYAYVGNDPLNATDPGGQAILTWSSRNDVRMTIYYTVDQSRARARFSPEQVASSIASRFTGSTTIGEETVRVTAEAIYVPPSQSAGVEDLKTITMFPVGELPRGGETGGRPYVADGMGGSQVHLNATDSTPQVAHELGGHTSGAGGQYRGDVAADGSPVTVTSPDANVMRNYEGKANAQTLGEIVRARTNPNRCAEGVRSITGAC
jgi:hypothetical protein